MPLNPETGAKAAALLLLVIACVLAFMSFGAAVAR